jgi:ABC-type multidrug transport system ATPase subunit
MTSLWRYSPSEGDFTIEGRDFLSTDPVTNHQFSEHNHVLIPYCSSDLWLGDDNRSLSRSGEFRFDPDKTDSIQFTLRGSRILRSAIKDLINMHSLKNASEVVLVGSSAGGIGLVNHVKWIRESIVNASQTSSPPTTSVILDSAWFIDFRGSISELILSEVLKSSSQGPSELKSLLQLDSCQVNVSYSDIPCCFLPECVVTNSAFYPVADTPTLVVQSLYDVFILAVSLRNEIILNSNRGEKKNCPLQLCSQWNGRTGSANTALGGFSITYLQRASEYAGVMNVSMNEAARENPLLSFHITSCFQHVYFAPSNLVGDSSSIFGNNSDLFATGEFSTYISHTQEANRWRSISMPVWPSPLWNGTTRLTIQDTIDFWRGASCVGGRNSENCSPLHVRQSCLEPHCDINVCPDRINYEVSRGHLWEIYENVLVAIFVLVIAALSFFFFVFLKTHYFIVNQFQQRHITNHTYSKLYPDTGPYPFPSAMVGGYSLACKNLTYSVKYQRKKHKITDEAQLLVLAEIDINPNRMSTTNNTLYRNHNANGNLDRKNWEQEPRTAPDGQTEVFANSFKCDEYTDFGKINKGDSLGQDEARIEFGDEYPTFERSEHSSRRGTLDSRENTAVRPKLRRTATQMSITVARNYVTKQVEEIRNTDPVSRVESSLSSKTKNILKDVSLYFNPGELVAVMGPSGCGKTTLLDILTGRRKDGTIEGDVLINGFPLNLVRSDFVDNTGYLMQLVAPYYEELTVRENLTLAAQLRLPSHMKYKERFNRIENVIKEVNLEDKADVVVGGSYGPGLSGGQKRRLAIAIQLLKEPQVLVLDEPTSGLDSNASFDMLTMLNQLTKSRRTIIMTIHQPRLEIFHMFSKIVFLCEGQVAYFGKPALAYEVCTMALKKKLAAKNQVWLGLEDHNPADIIVDMLGNKKFRRILIEHYNESREPKWVKRAIKQATYNADISIYTKESTDGRVKISAEKANVVSRLSAFEARAAKRTTIGQLLYLPLFFALYGLLLGTVYLSAANPFLIVSGFCVYSVASALFMFPAMHLSFSKALDLYTVEHLDGIGRSFDLVIQGFTRFVTLAFIPVVFCAGILYLMAIPLTSYSWVTFLELALVNVTLNQTWVALLTLVITAFPSYCIRISPVLAAVFGFASGFFIPVGQMPPWWCWLFYINPNFYGFSSSAFILLSSLQNSDTCTSELECYVGSGRYILEQFQFTNINPYLNITILMVMTIVFLLAATVAMAIRHTDFRTKWGQISVTLKTKMKQMKGAPSNLRRSLSNYSSRHIHQSTSEMVQMEVKPQREARPSLLEDSVQFGNPYSQQHPSQSSSDIDDATDGYLTEDFESVDGEIDDDDDFDEELRKAFPDDTDVVPEQQGHTHHSGRSDVEVEWPGYRTIHETKSGNEDRPTIPLTLPLDDSFHQVESQILPEEVLYDYGYDRTASVTDEGVEQATPITKKQLYATEPRKPRSSSFIRDQMESEDQVPELPIVPSRQGGVSSRLSSSTSAVHTPVPPSPAYSHIGGRKISSLSKMPVKHTLSEHNVHQQSAVNVTHQQQRSVSVRKPRVQRSHHKSMYLDRGERHNVWTPMKQQRPLQMEEEEVPPTPAPPTKQPSVSAIPQSQSVADIRHSQQFDFSPEAVSSANLIESRKQLESRIQAAQEVGREVTNQIAYGNHKWVRNYSQMVTRRQKRKNRMNLRMWSKGQEGEEEIDGDFVPKAARRGINTREQQKSAHDSPMKGKHSEVKLTKSPSVPTWENEQVLGGTGSQDGELSFDTLKKRKQGEGWRKGMKKVLVHAKTRPLPIHVYKQLLLNSGSPATTSAVQDSDTAAQRNSRPLSASLEESGRDYSEQTTRKRTGFNRMSMPASKGPHQRVPPHTGTGTTQMRIKPVDPTPKDEDGQHFAEDDDVFVEEQ